MSVPVCYNCKHLDKSVKETNGAAYRYDCVARPDEIENGFSSFWLQNDNELKTCGCSKFEEKEDYYELYSNVN